MALRGWMGPQWGNHFYMCLYWKKSLKYFFRISWQISIKLDTNHPCIKGIKVYTKSSNRR
jgi:hypothetical protein